MPRKAPTPCRHPGCRQLVAESGYCAEHAKDKIGWADDRQRGNRHERGYGAWWTQLRDRILKRDGGLCQPCLKQRRIAVAVAVDHVVAKADGGTDAESNLQAICEPCHKAKTARESARGRMRKPA